jgi:hypothetical protein
MNTLEKFDQKNGILGWDRDCYLSVIRYLKTNILRNYVGLSEESFDRINHLHYHLYRMRYNEIHIRKLLEVPIASDVEYYGRTIIANTNSVSTFIFKEILSEDIFELKLRYNGNCISIQQTQIDKYPYFQSGIGISSLMDTYKIHLQSSHHYWEIPTNLKEYQKADNNTLTLILDMNEGKDMLFFKINDVLIPYAISGLIHDEQKIKFGIGYKESITVISATHLKNLPVDVSKISKYYSYDNEDDLKQFIVHAY